MFRTMPAILHDLIRIYVLTRDSITVTKHQNISNLGRLWFILLILSGSCITEGRKDRNLETELDIEAMAACYLLA